MTIKISKIWGLVAALLLSFSMLLSACSSATSTATPIAAVALPSVVISPTGVPTSLPVTATPVVVATNGTTVTPAANTSIGASESSPTVVPTASGTAALSDSTISSNTETPEPSPTPTLEGTPAKVDTTYELKLIKTAYDAINEHLFRVPDTGKLLTACLSEVASITNQNAPTDISFGNNPNENWTKFTTAFNNIVDNATKTNNFTYPKGQLAHRVVTAMADAVNDEHTYFLSADELNQRNDLLSGDNTSVGFGIVITIANNVLYIVRPVPNSPADKAGLKPGDEIIGFDGDTNPNQIKTTVLDASANLTHTFTIKRPNVEQPLTFKIVKGQYTLPTVEYRLINKNIGYIAIRDFFTNVAEETDKAMRDLYSQGAREWIIDVRDDPGGVDAEEVVGRFVKGDQIMGYTKNRKDQQPDKVSNDGVDGPDKGQPFSPVLPMTVLVNEDSASSSEIFALAMRDFNVGELIGETTAGALGHTEAFALGDGTAISVTVDEYLSAKKEELNGVGVTPDIIVPLSIDDLASGSDPQLVAAVSYLDKTPANTGSK